MTKLAFTLGSFILPKYMIKSFDEVQNSSNIKSELKDEEEERNQPPDHMYNFFGYLQDEDLDTKKERVLLTYKLIFRFSIEKLIIFIKDDTFLTLLLHYISETKLERFHQRQVLSKNLKAYYRAIENMINLSEKNVDLIDIFNEPVNRIKGNYIMSKEFI